MPARIVKIELGGDVDHGRLDEDADHPPVTGGNSATSRAPDSGASGPIIAPSIAARMRRSEEHTSELQSLMRISYAVFCLKKKKHTSSDMNLSHYLQLTNK